MEQIRIHSCTLDQTAQHLSTSSVPIATSMKTDKLKHSPITKGKNREHYDEYDLLSECSSPVVYTPGRFLQLLDLPHETYDSFDCEGNPSDSETWNVLPVSSNRRRSAEDDSLDLRMQPLSPCRIEAQPFLSDQIPSRRPRTLVRRSLLGPLCACLVLAALSFGVLVKVL